MEDSPELRRGLRAASNVGSSHRLLGGEASRAAKALLGMESSPAVRRLNSKLAGPSPVHDALRTVDETKFAVPGSVRDALRTVDKTRMPSSLSTATIDERDRIRPFAARPVVVPDTSVTNMLLEESSRVAAEAHASRVERDQRIVAALERSEARAEKAEASAHRNFIVAVVAAAFGAVGAIAAVIAIWPN